MPMYKNFDEAAKDVLELLNTLLREKLLFITRISNDKLTVLKTLDNKNGSEVTEGATFELKDTL